MSESDLNRIVSMSEFDLNTKSTYYTINDLPQESVDMVGSDKSQEPSRLDP